MEKATLGQTISQDKETGTKETDNTDGSGNSSGSDNSSGNPGIVIGIVFGILLVIFVAAVDFFLLRRYGGLFVSDKIAINSGPKKKEILLSRSN